MAPNAVIKVVGVGGGGGNAVAHMVNSAVDGVEFITANTDSQAIKNCGAKLQLQLGTNVTRAWAQARTGSRARPRWKTVSASWTRCRARTWCSPPAWAAAPAPALRRWWQLAKEMGILTVAVVTKPFRSKAVAACRWR